jgi:hypothetical protein
MSSRVLFLVLLLLPGFYPGLLPSRGKGSQERDPTNPGLITPAEVALYRQARPIVELSQAELRSAYPELKHLQFDLNRERLGPLLRALGERVETMFQDLPNTASREDVRREFRSLGYRQEGSKSQTFNYLFLPRRPDEGAGWIEVRTDRNGKPIPLTELTDGGFLTSGFAGLGYFLHPKQQSGTHFRYLGRDMSKAEAHVIAFAQDVESSNILGSFIADGVAHPLLFQGIAWIDPQSYLIIRMHTGLLAPRGDLGLYRQDTDLWFAEVRFDDRKRTLWLPREVVVTIQWKNRVFTNRHRYSNYRLFTVETHEKRELPTPRQPPR